MLVLLVEMLVCHQKGSSNAFWDKAQFLEKSHKLSHRFEGKAFRLFPVAYPMKIQLYKCWKKCDIPLIF